MLLALWGKRDWSGCRTLAIAIDRSDDQLMKHVVSEVV
jgi:hypothetical protein